MLYRSLSNHGKEGLSQPLHSLCIPSYCNKQVLHIKDSLHKIFTPQLLPSVKWLYVNKQQTAFQRKSLGWRSHIFWPSCYFQNAA